LSLEKNTVLIPCKLVTICTFKKADINFFLRCKKTTKNAILQQFSLFLRHAGAQFEQMTGGMEHTMHTPAVALVS
jgi:hypothetical protein